MGAYGKCAISAHANIKRKRNSRTSKNACAQIKTIKYDGFMTNVYSKHILIFKCFVLEEQRARLMLCRLPILATITTVIILTTALMLPVDNFTSENDLDLCRRRDCPSNNINTNGARPSDTTARRYSHYTCFMVMNQDKTGRSITLKLHVTVIKTY